MNDPDEHTLDEAWGEDEAVPDQARPTLRRALIENRERYIESVIGSFVNQREGAFEDADYDATERAARRQWNDDNPLLLAIIDGRVSP